MNAANTAWGCLVCAAAGIAWDSLGLLATALILAVTTVGHLAGEQM